MSQTLNTTRCLIASPILLVVVAILSSGCWRDEAERRAKQVQDEADRLAAQAEAELVAKALQKAAREAKQGLDEVMPSKTEYELVYATPEEGSERLQEHESRLAKMDRVEIEGITVGYEEREERSFGGKTYERHFRASWVSNGRVLGVSYYSMKAVDAVAFVNC